MSKGSQRRPRFISDEEWAERYERAMRKEPRPGEKKRVPPSDGKDPVAYADCPEPWVTT